MFFLTNYRVITYMISLFIFLGISYLFFPSFLTNPLYDLIMLVSCFFVTDFSIEYVGLDNLVQNELKKITKEKDDK